MKRFCALSVVVAILALCVGSVALAQPGGGRGGPPGGGFGGPGGFGGGGGLLGLTQIDKVKKEIELLDDQAKEIEKMNEDARKAREARPRTDYSKMSEQERDKAFAESRARREKEAAEANAKLEKILLPHQIKRLKEISLQQRGLSALSDPEVAAQLKLTDEQKKKLEQVNNDNREAMRKLFQGGNRDGSREKFQDMRKEAEGKVLAVLTADQKAQFEKMKGEKFEMPEMTRGGTRGGNRGGQGGAKQ